ncbi:hypothetical protein [Ekhidna sp.]|uniref:hypothetical protein n=1 Tax=Ekhidna sp. TaxID=2608089 RepID=UPI003C7C758A
MELATDSLVKKNLHNQTLKHISIYLESQPTDTFALGHYCGQALEIISEKELYERLDSMSKYNDFNPVYEFVISTYLPNYLERYRKLVEESKEARSI